MTTERPHEGLIVLSAPVDIARTELRALRAAHPEHRFTIYLRQADAAEFGDLLDGCVVRSDKPGPDKRAFLTDLRGTRYDDAFMLDFGQWSFHPARALLFFVRSKRKTVRTERGAFRMSLWSPGALLGHWHYRRKNRTGSVAGLPPRTPAPFVLATYRKTIGLCIGIAWAILEYGLRRLRI